MAPIPPLGSGSGAARSGGKRTNSSSCQSSSDMKPGMDFSSDEKFFPKRRDSSSPKDSAEPRVIMPPNKEPTPGGTARYAEVSGYLDDLPGMSSVLLAATDNCSTAEGPTNAQTGFYDDLNRAHGLAKTPIAGDKSFRTPLEDMGATPVQAPSVQDNSQNELSRHELSRGGHDMSRNELFALSRGAVTSAGAGGPLVGGEGLRDSQESFWGTNLSQNDSFAKAMLELDPHLAGSTKRPPCCASSSSSAAPGAASTSAATSSSAPAAGASNNNKRNSGPYKSSLCCNKVKPHSWSGSMIHGISLPRLLSLLPPTSPPPPHPPMTHGVSP